MTKLLCRIGLHGYEEVRNTGFTAYYECRRCGKRKCAQGRGGFQPVNRAWLDGGEWEDGKPEKPTRGSITKPTTPSSPPAPSPTPQGDTPR